MQNVALQLTQAKELRSRFVCVALCEITRPKSDRFTVCMFLGHTIFHFRNNIPISTDLMPWNEIKSFFILPGFQNVIFVGIAWYIIVKKFRTALYINYSLLM